MNHVTFLSVTVFNLNVAPVGVKRICMPGVKFVMVFSLDFKDNRVNVSSTIYTVKTLLRNKTPLNILNSDMSINKAQAAAIADGFLDELGGEDDGFRPAESVTQFVLLAASLVEDAQENLNTDNTNASGRLSESVAAQEPVVNGGTIIIDIEMLLYGQFVNSGVKGRKSGAGVYAFKHDLPSRAMVNAIKKYISTAGRKLTNVNRSKTVSKNELKNASVSEISSAYAMARSIIQHGIKATHFMDRAITSTNARVQDNIAEALRIDIINALPDKL